MKRATVRWSALTVAAGLSLTGCASGTGESTGGGDYDPDAELSGALEVMGFGATDEIGETRLAEAEAALGSVEVSLVEGDLDIQQFLSAVATGEPPEIVNVNRDQIGTFASRGAIMPLDECIEGEDIDTSVFREPALDQVTFDDSVYGIPEFNTVQITQANSELMDAAGVTLDDVNGSDWEAISAANSAMHQGDGGELSVIGFDSKLPEFFPLWAKANGADLLSEDGRTAQLDDPKALEALEWAVSIYDTQGGFGAVKAYRDSADFFGEGNQFATNVLGAMPMEQWYVNVLNDVSPDAPLTFDTLRNTDGEPISFASGSAWAIPADSENPEAACRFAKTMTATESWVKAAEARVQARSNEGKMFTGLLTGNEEADDQIYEQFVTSGSNPKWDEAVEATYEANEHTFSLPANPADSEFKTAWQDAVNRVLNGQQEPKAALEQAQNEAQEALDSAWAEWEADED